MLLEQDYALLWMATLARVAGVAMVALVVVWAR